MWIKKEDFEELKRRVEHLREFEGNTLNFHDSVVKFQKAANSLIKELTSQINVLDSTLETHFNDHNNSVRAQVREEVEKILEEKKEVSKK